jgi:hypothetical protein
MGQVLPDRIGRDLPGDEPIPDSSVKDRLRWRLKGT